MSLRYLLFLFAIFYAAAQAETVYPNRQIAAEVIADQVRTDSLKKEMLAALSRHPAADRWAGTNEKQIFGISVVSFSNQDVQDGNVRMLRNTARLLAVKEMLVAQVLLDKYADTGLTDTGSLREAVVQVNESFTIQGKIIFDMEETFIENNHIVGIAVADRRKITATMTEPARMNTVRIAYREIVHLQARQLMIRQKYEEALHRLLALRQAKLLDQEQLWDVLRCFIGLNKPADTEKIISTLLRKHSEDVILLRRIAVLTAAHDGMAFRKLTDKLQAEINRLDPPECTAEEVLNQLLNELSGMSPVQ